MTGWEMLEELSKLADQNCYELDKPIRILLRIDEHSWCFTPTTIQVTKDKISGESGIFID